MPPEPKQAPQSLLLGDYGIGETQAADLRSRLRTFEEDWYRPKMDGYDALEPHAEEPNNSQSREAALPGVCAV